MSPSRLPQERFYVATYRQSQGHSARVLAGLETFACVLAVFVLSSLLLVFGAFGSR